MGCRDGFLARCEVYGEVRATSRLSGMPDVTVTFTNPSILNDVSFHPCVRYKSWEANQKLSFVPPDGSFKLMSYRVKNLKNTPIYVKPQLSSGEGVVTVNVMVGIRADPGKPVDSIVVQLPLPPAVASSDLSANHGTVTHNHNTKVLTA
jgi:AP-3 complex subunit mu